MNCLKSLYKNLRNEIKLNIGKEMVIICIGTDRSTGDSLGPLVGTMLFEMKIKNFNVYGTLENPVHAMNLHETLDLVKKNHPNSYIIGIDACLGKEKNVGKIWVKNKPVKPGEGVGKELPPVGDCSIIGNVNVSGFMEFFVLQNTRLSLVMKMAKDIAEIIKQADRYISRKSRKSRLYQEAAVTLLTKK